MRWCDTFRNEYLGHKRHKTGFRSLVARTLKLPHFCLLNKLTKAAWVELGKLDCLSYKILKPVLSKFWHKYSVLKVSPRSDNYLILTYTPNVQCTLLWPLHWTVCAFLPSNVNSVLLLKLNFSLYLWSAKQLEAWS